MDNTQSRPSRMPPTKEDIKRDVETLDRETVQSEYPYKSRYGDVLVTGIPLKYVDPSGMPSTRSVYNTVSECDAIDKGTLSGFMNTIDEYDAETNSLISQLEAVVSRLLTPMAQEGDKDTVATEPPQAIPHRLECHADALLKQQSRLRFLLATLREVL